MRRQSKLETKRSDQGTPSTEVKIRIVQVLPPLLLRAPKPSEAPRVNANSCLPSRDHAIGSSHLSALLASVGAPRQLHLHKRRSSTVPVRRLLQHHPSPYLVRLRDANVSFRESKIDDPPYRPIAKLRSQHTKLRLALKILAYLPPGGRESRSPIPKSDTNASPPWMS